MDHKQTFFKDLLDEFDKNSLSHPDEDEIEESLSTRSNDRALQIIQENSEILERLLNKKTTPCHPDQFEDSTARYPEPETTRVEPDPVPRPQPQQIPMVKRRISQTSSNGSTSSNPSVKSTITLQSNPATKPITFNPFPNSARATRKPKEVGRKLGLYK